MGQESEASRGRGQIEKSRALKDRFDNSNDRLQQPAGRHVIPEPAYAVLETSSRSLDEYTSSGPRQLPRLSTPINVAVSRRSTATTLVTHALQPSSPPSIQDLSWPTRAQFSATTRARRSSTSPARPPRYDATEPPTRSVYKQLNAAQRPAWSPSQYRWQYTALAYPPLIEHPLPRQHLHDESTRLLQEFNHGWAQREHCRWWLLGLPWTRLSAVLHAAQREHRSAWE